MALFSEELEEYVPDGVSISHPVPGFYDGKVGDCFLIYSSSPDGSKYTVPTARIVIDSENRKLIDFKTAEEMPFSVYDGTDYFTDDLIIQNIEKSKKNEEEYQKLYLRMREVAFKKRIKKSDREDVAQYIASLRAVELIHLQPYLLELGHDFFEWAKAFVD